MTPAKLLLIRVAYLLAAAAAAWMGVLTATGQFTALLDAFGRGIGGVHGPGFPSDTLAAVTVLQGVFFAALMGVLVFLAVRPFWWGKLICFGTGLSWVLGAAMFAMMVGFSSIVDYQIAAGAALLLAALLHQIADPRFD
jgi:hypothetical protein